MVSSKHRKINNLRRKEEFKKPRKSVLIVCEGSKTEPVYFNGLKQKLRLKMTDVRVVHDGSAPISVVDCAIRLRDERQEISERSLDKFAYDMVYCVMDSEGQESLDRAIDKAVANNLEIILSNPCFEYWYILHFEKTGKAFLDAKKVTSKLKKHFPKYKKNDNAIFETVYPKTTMAIKNAKAVIKECHQNSNDLKNCNPSTHVYKVVELLRKMR